MEKNEKTTADGIEQTPPENMLDAGSDTTPPKLTAEEIAALTGGDDISGPDEKNVPLDSIAQEQAAEQARQDKSGNQEVRDSEGNVIYTCSI